MKTSGITVLYGDDGLPLTRPASLAFYCGRIVYCLPWSIVNLKSLGLIATFSKNQCLHLRHRNEFRCLKSDCISASVNPSLLASRRPTSSDAICFAHSLFTRTISIIKDYSQRSQNSEQTSTGSNFFYHNAAYFVQQTHTTCTTEYTMDHTCKIGYEI